MSVTELEPVDVNLDSGVFPTLDVEHERIPWDGAPLSGDEPTPGLPLDSARTPDPESIATVSGFERVEADVDAAAGAVLHISEDGLHLIEQFEGFSPTIYLDSVGVRTIGYGTTEADISPLPESCTREQAEGWLREKMASKYEPAVRGVGVELNQHEFDALCSFVYNLGPGSLAMSWTIGRVLREKNYQGAADAMLLYDRAGGVVLLGLLNRRKAERALFLEPMPKPADPHRLLWSPEGPFKIDGKKINERHARERMYALLAAKPRDAKALKTQEAKIALLRQRVWFVAHHDPSLKHPLQHARWSDAHLGWRYHELNRLSNLHV